MEMKVVAALVLFHTSLAITMVRGTSEVDQWLHTIAKAKEKVTHLHFYVHDILSGPNPTAISVAQGPESIKSPTLFGIVDVIDDYVTEGPEPTSKPLGRVQGITSFNSFSEKAFAQAITFVFTNGEFKGSTLVVLGQNRVLLPVREISIVGGTGAFRLARGIVTTKTFHFNTTTFDGIYEYDVVVFHY